MNDVPLSERPTERPTERPHESLSEQSFDKETIRAERDPEGEVGATPEYFAILDGLKEVMHGSPIEDEEDLGSFEENGMETVVVNDLTDLARGKQIPKDALAALGLKGIEALPAHDVRQLLWDAGADKYLEYKGLCPHNRQPSECVDCKNGEPVQDKVAFDRNIVFDISKMIDDPDFTEHAYDRTMTKYRDIGMGKTDSDWEGGKGTTWTREEYQKAFGTLADIEAAGDRDAAIEKFLERSAVRPSQEDITAQATSLGLQKSWRSFLGTTYKDYLYWADGKQTSFRHERYTGWSKDDFKMLLVKVSLMNTELGDMLNKLRTGEIDFEDV